VQSLGAELGTNRGQKMAMTLMKAHQRNFLICTVFMQVCMMMCTKADSLSEYVVPLHFQKCFLYYDTKHAGHFPTVFLVAKWTFFQILLVPGTTGVEPRRRRDKEGMNVNSISKNDGTAGDVVLYVLGIIF